MLGPLDTLSRPMGYLNGMRLIRDNNLLIATGRWEWAHVRSRGRALRRNKKHRQNVYQIMRPDPTLYSSFEMIIGHPAMIHHVVRKVDDPSYVIPKYDESSYQPILAGPPPLTDPKTWRVS